MYNLLRIMIYTGFYIIPIMLLSEFYKNIKLNLGIVMGLIIPDLTIFLNYLNFKSAYHGSFSHSIISIILFYTVLLIVNEMRDVNNKVNIKIINGILMGMLIHVIFDIILSVGSIAFYWPLPIPPIDPIYKINLTYSQLYIITILHCFALRIFAYLTLQTLLKAEKLPNKCYKSINLITRLISFQSLCILLLIVMYLLKFEFYLDIINFCLLSSLAISVYFTYNIKEITEEDIIIG